MIHIHRHKKAKDAPEPIASEKQALIRDFLIKTETKDRDVAVQYLRAKSWDLDRAVRGWEQLNKTKDLAANKSGKPSTDMERRNCIMEVAKQGDCTNATAENYLCLNDWNIQSALRDLKRDRSQGFVVDAVRDGVVQYVRDAEAIRVKKADFEKATVGQNITIAGRTGKVKAKHTNGGILGLEVEWQQGATSAYENWKKGEVELEKARQQGSGSQYFRSNK